MRDDDTEYLIQSGLLCAADNLSMGRDVNTCALSIQLCFGRPRRRPPSSPLAYPREQFCTESRAC
ncbi:hypothetical protein DPMN_173613 [Dreissena polymorpha]|uniref:Uncharacterized protein n=1 Tax=Dreissena polymorpha TaxID=45954 RepID=A0A9D4E5E8_DREPO|nr:hypothetical protein DPMN_173613 [Dreissena polymorpha]